MRSAATARSTWSDMGGLLQTGDCEKALVGGGAVAARLVDRGARRGERDGAHLLQRAQLAGGARLREHVAQRRRLHGPGEDRALEEGGGQAAQQLVAGATADDVHALDALAGHPLEALEHEAVLARERDE